MNRAQFRAQKKKQKKTPNLIDPSQAQNFLENLPIETLIAGINNSLGVLEKRGIKIKDWDFRDRELYRVKMYGGKLYFLAAEQNTEDNN